MYFIYYILYIVYIPYIGWHFKRKRKSEYISAMFWKSEFHRKLKKSGQTRKSVSFSCMWSLFIIIYHITFYISLYTTQPSTYYDDISHISLYLIIIYRRTFRILSRYIVYSSPYDHDISHNSLYMIIYHGTFCTGSWPVT